MTPTRRRLLGALLLLSAIAPPVSACPERDAAEVRRRFADKPVWVVGERHRVAANHRLFGELVAGALEAGESVLVGLEIPADRQAWLAAALAGDGGLVAPQVIDCPSYRELLARLGTIGAAYPGRLRVLAIDAPSGVTGDRDRHMAEVLGRAWNGAERVLVLVGNLHALRGGVSGEDGRVARLADLLGADGAEVASLLQLGTGAALERRSSGLLATTAARARPALGNLSRLAGGPEHRLGPWLARAADGVILRP